MKHGLVIVLIAVLSVQGSIFAQSKDQKTSHQIPVEEFPKRTREEVQKIERAIVNAFTATHEGWSSDEVVLQEKLNEAFLKRCREKVTDVSDSEFNWRLLNLRKAGKLEIKTTRQNNRSYADVAHVAEIASRMMHDKYDVSTDRMMTDLALRAEFDRIARNVDDDIDLYLVRKSAYKLRKTRKLRPELITRVADWDRQVSEHSASELVKELDSISTNPGIYILRDQSGYLYIGEAENLQVRLKQHLDESDRKSLASYLKENGVEEITIEIHSFDPESRAKELMVRRAYESELIRSRKPKFNIRP